MTVLVMGYHARVILRFLHLPKDSVCITVTEYHSVLFNVKTGGAPKLQIFKINFPVVSRPSMSR